jgi:hypothetical protein
MATLESVVVVILKLSYYSLSLELLNFLYFIYHKMLYLSSPITVFFLKFLQLFRWLFHSLVGGEISIPVLLD